MQGQWLKTKIETKWRQECQAFLLLLVTHGPKQEVSAFQQKAAKCLSQLNSSNESQDTA
jgi:hypothetical protein